MYVHTVDMEECHQVLREGSKVCSHLSSWCGFFGATRRIPRPKGVRIRLDIRRARALWIQPNHRYVPSGNHQTRGHHKTPWHEKARWKQRGQFNSPIRRGNTLNAPKGDVEGCEPQSGLILLRVGDPSGHPARARFGFRRP